MAKVERDILVNLPIKNAYFQLMKYEKLWHNDNFLASME